MFSHWNHIVLPVRAVMIAMSDVITIILLILFILYSKLCTSMHGLSVIVQSILVHRTHIIV